MITEEKLDKYFEEKNFEINQIEIEMIFKELGHGTNRINWKILLENVCETPFDVKDIAEKLIEFLK